LWLFIPLVELEIFKFASSEHGIPLFHGGIPFRCPFLLFDIFSQCSIVKGVRGFPFVEEGLPFNTCDVVRRLIQFLFKIFQTHPYEKPISFTMSRIEQPQIYFLIILFSKSDVILVIIL